MDKLDLLVDSERLLGEIGQKAVERDIRDPSLLAGMLQWEETHLLRYLAMGSAGFDLMSLRNPEKLKAGSPEVVSLSVRSRSRSRRIGVEGPGTGVSSVTPLEEGPGAGVANGSNSETSGTEPVPAGMGVAAPSGVWAGKSFGTGLGAGAEGTSGVAGVEEVGAGVFMGSTGVCLGGVGGGFDGEDGDEVEVEVRSPGASTLISGAVLASTAFSPSTSAATLTSSLDRGFSAVTSSFSIFL